MPKQDTLYIPVNGSCDSVLIVDYFDASIDTLFLITKTCDSTKVGITVDRFPGKYCDSVVVMQTHLEKSYLDYNIRASCFKDSVGIDTISMQSINGCDSVIIQEVKYLPIKFEWSVDDVSCYQYNDGKINLINLKNANPLFNLF